MTSHKAIQKRNNDVTAIVNAVRRYGTGGYGVCGVPALVRETGLSANRIRSLMPLAVRESGKLFPGYRILYSAADQTFKWSNAHDSGTLATTLGRAKAGRSKIARAAAELDVAHAGPAQRAMIAYLESLAPSNDPVLDSLRAAVDAELNPSP